MFPLRDDNPTRRTPVVTMAVIVLNVLVWVLFQRAGVDERFLLSLCGGGAIPADLTGGLGPGAMISLGGNYSCEVGGLGWGTVLTSMFMHGSWMHLLGNMWFLWIFGNNIEDSMGRGRFVVFYLLSGLLATVAHVLSDPSSAVPTVGASGAISGVMGAYLLLYPRVRVHTLFVFVVLVRVFALPAWVVLAEWIVIQLFSGFASLGATGGGVAFWAHIGGFAAGLVLIKLFAKPELVNTFRTQPRTAPARFSRWA